MHPKSYLVDAYIRCLCSCICQLLQLCLTRNTVVLLVRSKSILVHGPYSHLCHFWQREKSSNASGSITAPTASTGVSGMSARAALTAVGSSSGSGGAMSSSLNSALTAGGHVGHLGEEPSDLEELEQFARTFKQRRIKLGFTQVLC